MEATVYYFQHVKGHQYRLTKAFIFPSASDYSLIIWPTIKEFRIAFPGILPSHLQKKKGQLVNPTTLLRQHLYASRRG